MAVKTVHFGGSAVTMDRRNDDRDPRCTYQKYFDVTVHAYARRDPATISYDDLTAHFWHADQPTPKDAPPCMLVHANVGGGRGLRRPIVPVPLPDASINEKDATVQNERKQKKERKEKKKGHDTFTTFTEKPQSLERGSLLIERRIRLCWSDTRRFGLIGFSGVSVWVRFCGICWEFNENVDVWCFRVE